jgi:short-subunit dehydrogenase
VFSRLDLRGSRVLLTGASSGIGRALGFALAASGARLALASRDRGRLDDLAAAVRQRGGAAVVTPADVTDAGQRQMVVESAASALGGLDVLVNNAGVGATGPFLDATEEQLRRVMEVNFFAATELTRLALPHLVRGRDPMVVNVASVLGRRAIPGYSEYCASKFALVGWSESLRAELAAHGVRVLVACPGSIQTSFRDNLVRHRARYPHHAKQRMSAERCAALIVAAMRRRRREVVITAAAKGIVWLNRLAPRLFDVAMEWYARRAGDTPPARPVD